MSAGEKLRTLSDADGKVLGYSFQCPGCNSAHALWTERADRPRWTFNGDMERPTFSPSLLINIGGLPHCHSFVENGRIRFLADCTHALAGQTVDLPLFD